MCDEAWTDVEFYSLPESGSQWQHVVQVGFAAELGAPPETPCRSSSVRMSFLVPILRFSFEPLVAVVVVVFFFTIGISTSMSLA